MVGQRRAVGGELVELMKVDAPLTIRLIEPVDIRTRSLMLLFRRSFLFDSRASSFSCSFTAA